MDLLLTLWRGICYRAAAATSAYQIAPRAVPPPVGHTQQPQAPSRAPAAQPPAVSSVTQSLGSLSVSHPAIEPASSAGAQEEKLSKAQRQRLRKKLREGKGTA